MVEHGETTATTTLSSNGLNRLSAHASSNRILTGQNVDPSLAMFSELNCKVSCVIHKHLLLLRTAVGEVNSCSLDDVCTQRQSNQYRLVTKNNRSEAWLGALRFGIRFYG